MKVRNKMLSALLAMGLSAGMIMPVTLTGCSGKSGFPPWPVPNMH